MIVAEQLGVIKSSVDIVSIIRSLLDARQPTEMHKEYFYAVGLDMRNRVQYVDLVAIGTVNMVKPDIREIVRMALIKNISNIIVSHNHPSGHSSPSHQDCHFTRLLKEACALLDISLLDHIIICDPDYSFADSGTL